MILIWEIKAAYFGCSCTSSIIIGCINTEVMTVMIVFMKEFMAQWDPVYVLIGINN